MQMTDISQEFLNLNRPTFWSGSIDAFEGCCLQQPALESSLTTHACCDLRLVMVSAWGFSPVVQISEGCVIHVQYATREPRLD
jgi:hypothetical protein